MERAVLWFIAALVVAAMIWQAFSAGGAPNPTAPHVGRGAATLDIGILVFREGLECVLVLAAITANMVGGTGAYRRPRSRLGPRRSTSSGPRCWPPAPRR